MDALSSIRFTISRLQIPVAVCSFDEDAQVLDANLPCAGLFGFPKVSPMVGSPLRTLAPEIETGSKDRWQNSEGVRFDGVKIPLAANLTDIQDEDEKYILVVFYDRTSNVSEARAREEERAREVGALLAAQRETQSALDEADRAMQETEKARVEAENLKVQADKARQGAEERLLQQQRLSGQMNLLRQVFIGTFLLAVLMGALIVAQWATGGSPEGLTMVKDILLVMTGILGSAMASMFDPRNRSGIQD
jgi:hypothetical protein